MADGDRVEVPRIERLTVPGAEPIEIWDLETDDGDILWNRQQDASVIVRAIAQLRAGTAVSRSSGPITAAADVDTVFMTGGRLANAALATALVDDLRSAGLTAAVSSDPVFVAAAAAAERFDGAVVVDVGQTQVKVVGPNGRAAHRRDLTLLPIPEDTEDLPASGSRTDADALSEQRDAFVAMVAGAIESVDGFDPAGVTQVILALPCAIESGVDGQLELGSSSYVGMAGDRQRLRGLAELIPDATWGVLNDAELAVFAAARTRRVDHPLVSPERQLVITFGFGLGGCVWDPTGEGRT